MHKHASVIKSISYITYAFRGMNADNKRTIYYAILFYLKKKSFQKKFHSKKIFLALLGTQKGFLFNFI